jgi:peptidoglycan/xylan/chitin deacetylase (PgdA/CDA1 family)
VTLYIAAYDTESPACLAACRKIVALHRRLGMPATFFVVGKRLEENPREYRELLSDPLFEVASHTYSHKTLRDHPWCGPAVPVQVARQELELGKEWVEGVFERPCVGVRPGCGFPDGLRGAPELVELVAGAGLRYISSAAWGPDYSLPAPLAQAHTYADEGAPDLWELPCHGWHENLLKDNNRLGPRRMILWPPPDLRLIPQSFVATPEEEFAVNRVLLETAAEQGLGYVSLIWHPWSLDSFDPDMRMLELTFARVRELGLEPGTFAGLRAALASPH